jgi:hypothetical protein
MCDLTTSGYIDYLQRYAHIEEDHILLPVAVSLAAYAEEIDR